MNNILLLNLRRYIEKTREDMSAIRFVASESGFDMVDFSVVVLIACEQNETIRYSKIAKKLVLKDSNVTACIRRMEKNGLCTVTRNLISGRAEYVRLSAKAIDLLNRIPEAVSCYEAKKRKVFLPLRLI